MECGLAAVMEADFKSWRQDPAHQVLPRLFNWMDGVRAGEALRNAFRHAHARRIEVEITYDDRQFRLQVRDDGKGMKAPVLADDRRGHAWWCGTQTGTHA
jgi:signal transduction histidine kinase